MSSIFFVTAIALIVGIFVCMEPISAFGPVLDRKGIQTEPGKTGEESKEPRSDNKTNQKGFEAPTNSVTGLTTVSSDTSIEQAIDKAKMELDKEYLDSAIKQFEAAISQIENVDKADRRLVQPLRGLATCFVHQGRLVDAEKTLKNALAIEKIIDKDNADASDTAAELATVYFNQAKYSEAEETYSGLLARKKILGKEDQALATAMHDFGRLRFKQGNYSEAEKMLKASAEIMEKLPDCDKFSYAKVLSSLALCYANQNNIDKAEETYKRACAELETSAPANSAAFVQTLREYAGVLRLQGRKREALKISDKAMKLGTYSNKEYKRNHPDFRVNYESYMKGLQRKIKYHWSPPSQDKTKKVAVIFKIHKAGELSDLRILESSGVETADKAAIDAVEKASPFTRLPYGSPNEVEVQFVFDYNVWR